MSEKLPPGIQNVFWFQAFNAICFSIAMGNPLILFAKDLGASATTIGLLTSVVSLTTILQIPAAQHVEVIGFRKLMVAGWTFRVLVLTLLPALPFLSAFLPKETLINLLLAIVFFFNVLRGAATCAWMPWISALVPPTIRGVYLAREAVYLYAAFFAAMVISSSFLFLGHDLRLYSLAFAVSVAGGAVSLFFLNRIPEGAPPAPAQTAAPVIAWGEILRDQTFRRLLAYGLLVQFGLSAHGTFIIVFLREQIGLGQGPILLLSAGNILFGMLALWLTAHQTDRHGSKPYLGIVCGWWLVGIFLWLLISGRALRLEGFLVAALFCVGGFFGSLFQISSTRLLMNTVGDRAGKVRYFAVFNVLSNLLIGLMPIGWGMVLDGLGASKWQLAGLEWTRFSALFAFEWLAIFFIMAALLRVKETRAQSTAEVAWELFVETPRRGLDNLFQWLQG